MKIAQINGFNSINLNQNLKKNPYSPNFGKFVIGGSETGASLVQRVGQLTNVQFAEKLVDLIEASKLAKGVVYIKGINIVQAFNRDGKQIYQTTNARTVEPLYSAVLNIVNAESLRGEVHSNPKQNTIQSIASRLKEIINDCPMVKNIQEFLDNQAKHDSGLPSVAA